MRASEAQAELPQNRDQSFLAELARDGVRDDAVSVDKSSVRKAANAVAEFFRQLNGFDLASHDRIVDCHFVDEFSHGVLIINRDPDDLKAMAFKLLLDFYEMRDLPQAGRAPRGPEIQQNNLTLPVADVAHVAVDIDHREFRPGAAEHRTGRGLDRGAPGVCIAFRGQIPLQHEAGYTSNNES